METPDFLEATCAALVRRPSARAAFSAGLSFGPAPDGALPLADPEAGPLAEWLAAEVAEARGAG